MMNNDHLKADNMPIEQSQKAAVSIEEVAFTRVRRLNKGLFSGSTTTSEDGSAKHDFDSCTTHWPNTPTSTYSSLVLKPVAEANLTIRPRKSSHTPAINLLASWALLIYRRGPQMTATNGRISWSSPIVEMEKEVNLGAFIESENSSMQRVLELASAEHGEPVIEGAWMSLQAHYPGFETELKVSLNGCFL